MSYGGLEGWNSMMVAGVDSDADLVVVVFHGGRRGRFRNAVRRC